MSTKQSRTKRDKYSKISLKCKLIFFEKVIHQQQNIKDVLPISPRSPLNLPSSIQPPKLLWGTIANSRDTKNHQLSPDGSRSSKIITLKPNDAPTSVFRKNKTTVSCPQKGHFPNHKNLSFHKYKLSATFCLDSIKIILFNIHSQTK